MEKQERGPGRLTRAQCELTPEQRAELGRDEFFTVEELARILGVSEQAIRNAIDRKNLPAYRVPNVRGEKVTSVKGWRAVIWRDALAGKSDGDENDFEAVS